MALQTQANQQCVKCCQRSRNSYTKVDKGLVFTDITHIVAHHRYCVSHVQVLLFTGTQTSAA
jgi:hypothetical protein